MPTTAPYPFSPRKVYSFTLYPTTVIPGDFSNVTVMGIIDYDTALQSADIPSIHVNVYPYIKQYGVPDDPSQYDYIKVKLANGTITVLGLPWINQSTIVLVQSLSATILLEGVDANAYDRIYQALVNNGFNNPKITIVAST